MSNGFFPIKGIHGKVAHRRTGGAVASNFTATIPVTTAGYMTMPMIARQGEVPSGKAIKIGAFDTDCEIKTRWPDNSARIVILSCIATVGTHTLTVVDAPTGTFTPTYPATVLTLTTRVNTHWPNMSGQQIGAGSTDYFYKISTIDAGSHESFATPALRVTSAAVMDASNFARLTWSAVTGASTYKIYKSTSYYGTYGLIATTAALTYDDVAGVPGATQPKTTSADDPGTVYTATLPAFSATDPWLDGAVCREHRYRVVPRDGSNNAMGSNINVLFDARAYSDGGFRVDFSIENIADSTSMDKFGPFDMVLTVGGVTKVSRTNITSYAMTRPHERAWHSTGADAVYTPDFEPFHLAKVWPRMNPNITPNFYDSSEERWNPWSGGFYGFAWFYGVMTPDMAAGGGRPELSYVHGWEAAYLVHKTVSQRFATIRTADVMGCFSDHLAKSDGYSMPKLGDAGYSTSWWFDTRGDVGNKPLAPTDSATQYFKGGRASYNTTHNDSAGFGTPSRYNEEHVSTPWCMAYLLTGDRWYVDQAKHWCVRAIGNAGAGWSQINAARYPGLYQGRNGATGNERILAFSGRTREYGWPLKVITSAVLIIPDADTTDKSYLQTTLQNNANYISSVYSLYLSLGYGGTHHGSTGGSEKQTAPGQTADWAMWRTMNVTNITNANPSVVTTDSAHHYETGDYLYKYFDAGTLYGPITVIDATNFSVPANISASGITQFTKMTANYGSFWRYSYTLYTADWMLRLQLVTDPGYLQATVDGGAKFIVSVVNDNTNFATNPGAGGWYPIYHKMNGKDITRWFDTYADFENENVNGWYDSGTTPGVPGFYAPSTGYHLPEHEAFCRIAKRRSIPGAQAAIDRFQTLTDYLTDKNQSSYQQGVGIEFGSEID